MQCLEKPDFRNIGRFLTNWGRWKQPQIIKGLENEDLEKRCTEKTMTPG